MDARIAVLSAAVFGGVMVAGAYGLQPAHGSANGDLQPVAQAAATTAAVVPAQAPAAVTVPPAPARVSEGSALVAVSNEATAQQAAAGAAPAPQVQAIEPQPAPSVVTVPVAAHREDAESPRTGTDREHRAEQKTDSHDEEDDD